MTGLSMRALGPGALLGAWLVEEARGRGGFAEVRRARLVDFGIAKPLDGRAALAHTTDTVLGTPRHMAPEQLCGAPVDARTDVYAFGLLAFEMLSGRPAFAGNDAIELEAQHLGAP